ncbi:MAG: RagB/SusD family nutrient uptake outer membrane protein [Bacteroidales bacterium]|nr:RagB/SusD family nutrient uptake outer membrane protein [Bacteroidales bacterium]
MKIKNIITVLCGLLILNSCNEDDLTILPDGRELDATFYQTDEQIIQALNGAYDPLQHIIWGGSTFLWGSVTSDDAVAGGENESDQRGYQVADLFITTAIEDDDQNLETFWTVMWRMNTRCNPIIIYANPESVSGSKGIANAYFLKGFAYFNMVRMFGKLPIVDDIPSIDSKYSRATLAETWDAIERYLTTAIDMTGGGYGLDVRVNQNDPTNGYATLGSAQMLLGKVYLYREKYSEAIDVLEDIVESGQYDLEANYADIFDPGNTHGIESVFEINFTTQGNQSWDNRLNNGNAIATLSSPRAFTNVIREFPDGIHYSGWGFNQPTQKLVQAFDDMGDDIRKYVSTISTDTLQYQCDTANPPLETIWQNSVTGYWDNKHCTKVGYRLSDTQVAMNVVAMRYADVLLMLAEAYNRSNQDGPARDYLNEVRERVDLDLVSSSEDALFEDIKKERQLELCLEGDRYFDLVRWGDAAEELTGDYELSLSYSTGRPGVSTNGLFPIPYDEIVNYGDFDFEQNPDY